MTSMYDMRERPKSRGVAKGRAGDDAILTTVLVSLANTGRRASQEGRPLLIPQSYTSFRCLAMSAMVLTRISGSTGLAMCI
jgi:hypothetical protein